MSSVVYSAPPVSLAGFKGPTSKGREGNGRKGRGRTPTAFLDKLNPGSTSVT